MIGAMRRLSGGVAAVSGVTWIGSCVEDRRAETSSRRCSTGRSASPGRTPGPGGRVLAVSSERRFSPAEARACAERAAELLARRPRVQLVYLFGSSTRPDAGATGGAVRDVDLAVSTDPPSSLEELHKLRAELVEEIHRPIDLVSLDHASIVLAHEVVEGGVCLYARSPEVETEFVTRSRARFWDWRPYREEQWRFAGERLEERRRGG